MGSEEAPVHIFSVHEPGTRSSTYVWRPVEPGHEQLTDEEVLRAEQEVQKFVHATSSKTASVKYFTLAGKASVHVSDQDYEPFFDDQRQA